MRFTMNAQVPDGTVLLMGIRYDGQTSEKVFTYVWLKAGGLWYSTGNARVPTAAGWGAVQRWLDADVGREVLWVRLVTETEQIWPTKIDGQRADSVTYDDLDGRFGRAEAEDMIKSGELRRDYR